MLTGDVPSQHLMRHVHSAGRRRQGHPADGAPVQSVVKQCACAMRRTVLIIPYTRSFPCTPRIHRFRMSGHEKIAPAANICSSKCYISYVPGPTCRGSVPLCMPPFSYKRGGMRRYKTSSIFRLRPKFIQTLKLSSNTTHSGVGYYAPAAQTTLNSCVFLCSFLHIATSKTLRPLLILGLRAGALRHPAEDFLFDSDHIELHDSCHSWWLSPPIRLGGGRGLLSM
jgi:hypothetical protein